MYNRIILSILTITLLTFGACNNQPDPFKIVKGKWKITAMTLADNPLDASMLEGSYFEFGVNGEFSDNIMGDRNKGAFVVNPEGTGFVVNYQGEEAEEEIYNFSEISASKMVLSGKSHGMNRTLVLEKSYD